VGVEAIYVKCQRTDRRTDGHFTVTKKLIRSDRPVELKSGLILLGHPVYPTQNKPAD